MGSQVSSATGPRVNGDGALVLTSRARPGWLRRHVVLLVALDVIAVGVATLVAHGWRFGLGTADLDTRTFAILAVVIPPTWLGVLAVTGCYGVDPFGTTAGEWRRVVRAGANFLALVAVAYFVGKLEGVGRGLLVAVVPLAVLLTLLLRAVGRWHLVRRRRRGHASRRTLVVGSRRSVGHMLDHLARHPDADAALHPVAAWTPDRRGPAGVDGHELQVFGAPESVLDALSQCAADTLVFTGGPALERIRDLAWRLEGSGVDVFVVPTLTKPATPLDVRPVAGLPLVYVNEVPTDPRRDGAG